MIPPGARSISRPLRRTASAVAAIATLVAFGPSAAGAAEPGVVPDLTWGISDPAMERTADRLKDAGPKWVRLDVRWHAIEPYARGDFSELELGRVDRAVEMSRAAGAKIDMLVYGAPTWASGVKSGKYYKNSPPKDPAEYARLMRFMAERYKGKVAAYEIWNEQNTPRFWPTTGPDPAAYTTLLKAAYGAIKETDPAAKVVFGGLSSYHYDFLEKAYAAGAQGHFDALGVHPYTDCGVSPDVVSRDSSGRIEGWSFTGYRELRKDMLARGDDKPIWVTEFGWSTSKAESCSNGGWSTGVSDETQAQYTLRAFEILEQDASYVPVGFVYSFRDYEVEGDPDTIETRFGLMRTDFSARPAYQAFKDYAAGRIRFSTPDASRGGALNKTVTTLRAARAGKVRAAGRSRRARARRVVLKGRVARATGGRVTLVIRLRRSRRKLHRTVRVNRRGQFRLSLRPRRHGRFVARAKFRGHRGLLPSRSRAVSFRA